MICLSWGANTSVYAVAEIVCRALPSSAFQTLIAGMVVTDVASCLLSEVQATAWPRPSSLRTSFPTSSKRMVLSAMPAARVLPSGDQATEYTSDLMSPSVLMSLKVSGFKICTGMVWAATATLLPSGCQEMERTGRPNSIFPASLPVPASQPSTTPLSPPAPTTVRPSGDQATCTT